MRTRLSVSKWFGYSLLAFGFQLALGTISTSGQSGNSDRWVGTWAAAPYGHVNTNGAFAEDTTLREIVHVSVGGTALRVVLTNEFGVSDLKIGSVTVAIPQAVRATSGTKNEASPSQAYIQPSSAILLETAVPVLFGGSANVTIAPGAIAISDPVSLRLNPLSDLAVTIFIPGQKIDLLTYHAYAGQLSFEAAGNQLSAGEFASPDSLWSWWFLKAIDVSGSAEGSIVCFGDSITDGSLSKFNANHRYPDILATRLQANPATSGLGVLNEGIGGNSVLHESTFTGPSALSRFDRDVIAQAGVRYVVILEGINDIGRVPAPKQPSDVIFADDLISAYKQMIIRAHLHGIKVIGATLTPYQGAHTDSPLGQAIRDRVNDFILNGGFFDGAVDFAKATADPENPKHYLKIYDGGDHLHPSDAGYRAMGESIDLRLFTK
jgi:lysophospholipase L1-like esterase